MKILVSGATGLVGKKLVKRLVDRGDEVFILTRSKAKAADIFDLSNVKVIEWSSHNHMPDQIPDLSNISSLDGVVNLIGENIGNKRWSTNQKKVLYDSRVLATKQIIKALKDVDQHIKFFVSASAIGIYPANIDEVIDESCSHADGFLGSLCSSWENSLQDLAHDVRKVIIRTSVILDGEEGALKKMILPFKLGLGGMLGSGKQVMSWIHIEDIVEIYLKAIDNDKMVGAYNASSPNPITNFEFTKTLGRSIKRPTVFPVPEFGLKIVFGEMASIILDSQKVISKRLESEGFKFKYPTIDKALDDIYR